MRTKHLNLMLTRLLCLGVFALLSGSLCAASYDEAMSALADGNYRMAYRDFKALAEEGDAEAQYRLGMLLLFGQGVKQRVAEGLEWLKRAADNGSYLAANELAQIYTSGREVAPDEQEAMKWIERATQLGKQQPEEADDGCE
ncbi:MAG: tetratricopeptide repeat protein [Candidatus Thiodiazotropha sp.]|jgi:TPR repeat protein